MSIPDLLSRRRDRAIAIVLNIKERDCDPYLPEAAKAKLRKVVLDQLNEFCELAIDLSRSLSVDGVVMNEVYLERLASLHSDVAELRELVLQAVG